MRIEKLITDYRAEKKKTEQQTGQVIIYDPENPPEIERAPKDNRVLFFIPDNGRDALKE